MILMCMSCLIVTALTQDIFDNVTENKTQLYPVENITINKHDITRDRSKIRGSASVWKIDAAYAHPKLEPDNNETESKEQPVIQKPDNAIKEFIPSPHLETYIEEIEEDTGLNNYFPKKPPEEFKYPKEFGQSSFLDVGSKDGWKVAQPITIKAGDLYKLPELLKGHDAKEQNFNVEIKNEQHVRVKKKMDPWRGLLRLMTAFIPVGLIVSALTPSVVTIQSNGPYSPIRNNSNRRSDVALNISDGCRRRMLCELHLENKLYRPGKKRCSRIFCDDPSSISRASNWFMKHSSDVLQNSRGDILTRR